MAYSTKWKRSALLRAAFMLLCGTISASVNACSGGSDDSSPGSPLSLGTTSSYAIHVFANMPDGTRPQLDFGPGTELAIEPGQSMKKMTPRLLPLDITDGGQVTAPPTVDMPGTQPWETAWALVARAASACDGVVYDALPPWGLSLGDPGAPTWLLYILNGYSACTERVHLEQDLLCTADKLEEIAEAVGQVTWPALQTSSACEPYSYGSDGGAALIGSSNYKQVSCEFMAEWDIPPQANKDRFVARDLAIYALSLIPVVDAFNDIDPYDAGAQSCSAVLATAAQRGVNPTTQALQVFGEQLSTTGGATYPTFPPSTVSLEQGATTVATTALQIEAQILRSGGRLLHDLIRTDVYADMASAAQLSAQAIDPNHGNRLAWGADPGQGPYGTLAHASRLLTGRWEIGEATSGSLSPSGVGDPRCEGVPAIGLLGDTTTGGAFGTDYAARMGDAPISTTGEATAARLVDQAGIVLPLCNILGNAATGLAPPAAGTLHAALVDQLLLQEQTRNGLPVNLSSPQRAIFEAVVAPLSDDEIAFAFERANYTYRLLTNAADKCAPFAIATQLADGGVPTGSGVDPGAGLIGLAAGPNGPAAQSVASLNGIVVSGGIARTRLSTDPMARAGGMLEASECGEGTANWSIWGTAASKAASALPYTLPTVDFQDAFHVGQAFERRLAVIRNVATLPTTADDPATVSRGGIAELRTWAGNTLVHAQLVGSPSYLDVQIAGLGYADLGLTATSPAATVSQAVQNAFGFVYGPPWVAECAAHLRADCPVGFDTTDVQRATSVATAGATAGDISPPQPFVYDTAFDLNLQQPWTAPNFNPPIPTPAAPGESHLYMVRLHDPNDPAGHGRVLGAISIRTGLVTSFVDAPMQRELLHDAIDLGKWVGAKPAALGDVSAANGAGFCVDGVPLDLFVPLDNELTAGGASYEDSWQHYLDLADQAAQTADALGQQLIADDLQISENQQGAAEQLANLCGDFGSLSKVTVGSNGSVSGAPDDQTTSSCLQEPTTDLVFLGHLPGTPAQPFPTDPAGVDKAVRQILNCPAAGAATTASTDPLCSLTRPLTAGWLGLIASNSAKIEGANSLTADCGQLSGIQASLSDPKKGFRETDFLTLLQDPVFGTSIMETLASSLAMGVTLWNEWSVTFGGELFMSSTNPNYWPACLGTANGCKNLTAPNQATTAETLNTTFRWCNGGDLNQKLGCDGGSADAELNVLKWRVMQALWAIAASAGDAPQGMFQLPVPVAAACGSLAPKMPWVSCTSGHFGVSEPALCNPNNKASCLPGFQLSTNDPPGPGENDVGPSIAIGVGTAYEIDPRFTEFTTNATKEIPDWYRNAYSHPQLPTVLHAMVSSQEAPFGACTWDGSFGPDDLVGCDPTPTPISLADMLTSMSGPAIEGSTEGNFCTAPFGSPAGNASAAPQIVRMSKPKAPVGPKPPRPPGPPTKTPSGQPIQGDLGQYLNPPVFTAAAEASMCSPAVPSVSVQIAKDPDGSPFMVDYSAVNGYLGTMNASGYTDPPGSFVNPVTSAFAYLGGNGGPIGECGGLAVILQAATLACLTGSAISQVDPTSPPPPVHSQGDLVLLEGWLSTASQEIANSLAGLYAESVPTRVVQDLQQGTVGTGDKGGTKGQALLQLEQDLQSIPSSWAQIAGDLAEVKNAITTVDLAIKAADLSQQAAMENDAMQQIQVQGQMAQAVIGFERAAVQGAISATQDSWSFDFPAAAGQVGLVYIDSLAEQQSVSTDNAELGIISQQVSTAADTAANQTSQALAQMNQTTGPIWTDLQKSIDSVHASVAAILADAQQIQLVQGQAAYQAAIGTGADFVDIAGQEVPIPVNTVLRRQASATAQRYATALTNAKALAYMARRAIEERIGVPLASITTPVGPLAAPAAWADDVCSLQGVNYSSLSTATGPDGGVTSVGTNSAADNAAISAFADAWVGDYVAKLRNFVTYYNTQYPSHQGDDTAILSLRYDLLSPATQCMTLAPNLLVSSGSLDNTGTSAFSAPGWQLATCPAGAGKCLALLDGADLVAPVGDPSGPIASDPSGVSIAGSAPGVSWLMDIVSPSEDAGVADGGVLDAGAADATNGQDASEDAGTQAGASSAPGNVVWQTVQLDPGAYLLSWWDQARSPLGQLLGPNAATVNYLAQIRDGSWTPVATYTGAPFTPTSSIPDAGILPSLWSPRRALAFTVTQSGTYEIGFGASTPGDSPGSVAIADVQLELAQTDGQPTTYIQTGVSRMVPALTCSLSDSDLRGGFQHHCDANGVCSYDLTLPMLIDTAALNAGGSPLDGKLAQDNYNFRHETIALNLVGTGVHDCTNDPSPDCYGTGYIEYDLAHDATSAGIVGYDGNARDFDFGIATIQHGKALATEQYVTMPLSSNDQQLVSQPGIQHIEFGGRPLDGAYRLRIWDSPDLNWNALQDVQIILNYEYWSQIQVASDQVRPPQRLKRKPLKPTLRHRIHG